MTVPPTLPPPEENASSSPPPSPFSPGFTVWFLISSVLIVIGGVVLAIYTLATIDMYSTKVLKNSFYITLALLAANTVVLGVLDAWVKRKRTRHSSPTERSATTHNR
ncbi:MAG: hypothetical protein CSA82_00845 [Actinobacteria bacterium]|nr:MAG: hypothetical protein CSA82_00845 [Actinomycetota bacterium]